MFTRSTLTQGRATRSPVLLALASAALMTAGAEVALAQCEADKITPSNALLEDYFGTAVALTTDQTVIGAPSNVLLGVVYMYRFDGARWVEEAKLTGSDAVRYDDFGDSVAISGELVIAGSPSDDHAATNAGSAYVFGHSGTAWIEEAKLTASDAAAYDCFGDSVGISGHLVVVGSPYDNHSGPDKGSAYVFSREGSTWAQEAKLTASDGADRDHFGYSVGISGDLVVVGSPDDNYADYEKGSAYVFRRGGTAWVEEAKLTAFDAAEDDHFGRSVDITGDLVVVGSPGHDHPVSDAGSAYLFRHDGIEWVQEGKLTASDAAEDDRFGFSVAVNGDLVIVGSPSDDYSGSNRGSAYLFRRGDTSWAQVAKLTALDSQEDDYFGRAVSMTTTHIIVGAPYSDSAVVDSGSAYVFQVSTEPDCNNNEQADACDIHQGSSDDCNSNGVPDECELCRDVEGTPCDEGQFCKFCADECDIPHNTGACTTFPQTCPEDWIPVCGCDGVTYNNECEADQGGISLASIDLCSMGCCLPGGACLTTTASSCLEQGGVTVPACLGDNDGDGEDDGCLCSFRTAPPRPDTLALPGNPINQKMRYLSFSAGDVGRVQAVQVTFNDLPPPYDTWNGLEMWVGQPETFCEGAGQVSPPCGPRIPADSFWAATLQCEPYFTDWSRFGVVNVFHEGTIPSATYALRAIDSTCAVVESNLSDPLIMTTSRWGDVVRNCVTCPCGPPDGVVGIPTDVTAVLDKFKNLEPPYLPCYPPLKVRTEHDWETPNQRIDISDVTFCLDAFRGEPYPPPAFYDPSPRPCSP
ncbi:MAG: hypothetical protein JSU86_14785 [Phycisphaerales bacterium]|nr:MAG: hypothetical protein JSU86_14785 [Phycisphaerales bacterium]